jgi:hypothetical protein
VTCTTLTASELIDKEHNFTLSEIEVLKKCHFSSALYNFRTIQSLNTVYFFQHGSFSGMFLSISDFLREMFSYRMILKCIIKHKPNASILMMIKYTYLK